MLALIETSQSALSTFQRCPRKYMYRYVRGLQTPGTASMGMGTLFHIAMADYYAQNDAAINRVFRAKAAIKRVIDAGGYEDRHNTETGFTTVSLEQEEINLLTDMIDYYHTNVGHYDKFDEILGTEVPASLRIAGYNISTTFDLLAKTSGVLDVTDHKTVSSIGESTAFMRVDFQLHSYALSAYENFGRPSNGVRLNLNMVRREVPPGFGHRSLKTASGRTSTASTAVGDYVRRESIHLSESQILAFKKEMENVVDFIEFAKLKDAYLRNPIKNGGERCGSCPYFDICHTELVGSQPGLTLLTGGLNGLR